MPRSCDNFNLTIWCVYACGIWFIVQCLLSILQRQILNWPKWNENEDNTSNTIIEFSAWKRDLAWLKEKTMNFEMNEFEEFIFEAVSTIFFP